MSSLHVLTSSATQEATAIVIYGLAEKAEATRRAYRADMSLFTDCCQLRRGIDGLGATLDAVAAFLAG